MQLTFLGAAGTVTGSRYFLQTDTGSVLVDCGLFQGLKSLRLRNWDGITFDPSKLNAVVLTHAHLDHAGYLPRLCAKGFTGPVYCTPGTKDLLGILLPDSGFLQEEEARHANKWGYAKHQPALPLYTRAEAERCLSQLVTIPYHQSFEPLPGTTARYTRAGHIIGSACVSITHGNQRLAFSGDVGRAHDPVLQSPEPLAPADYLVIESTYGDRRHPPADTEEVLSRIVQSTVERGGTLVIPAFAVGRAQNILYVLSQLKKQKRIPDVPIYLDSPMAINATEIYRRHQDEHRLSIEECEQMCEVAEYVRLAEDSKILDQRNDSMVIISASGMGEGGRVLHHFKRFLPEDKNTILFVGYQAAGTRGRSLVDKVEEIKIHGRYIPVRARIEQIENLSAHADYRELLDWLKQSGVAPRTIFVTHGEPSASDAFRRRLEEEFDANIVIPAQGDSVVLEG